MKGALYADKDRLELQTETDKQDRYLDIVGDALGDLTRAARVRHTSLLSAPETACNEAAWEQLVPLQS